MTDEPELPPAAEPAPPEAPVGLLEPGAVDAAPEETDHDLWDHVADWVMQRGALPALGVLTLGMFVLYAGVFRGEVAGDDLTFHMAESARIADCLRAGDFDFWNPSANAGFASAYYYQVVPQLVSAIPTAVFGQHLLFFQLSVFLPLALAPAAAYRGMRLVGATPWQAAIAALAIGLLNGASRWGAGNAGTFQVGLYTQTWALAAFPLALGHAVRWATDARGLAPAIAWGAFVTLCHPFGGASLVVALVAGWLAAPVIAGADRLLRAIGDELTVEPAVEPETMWTAGISWLGERWRGAPRPWLGGWLGELRRLAILGGCLAVASLPFWLPLIVDYVGFGGFPHRVADEDGPGFHALLGWYARGELLDFERPGVLTWSLPIVALFARARFLRWLWTPAVFYAVWLGLGPHVPKTDDDLLPAVRFLGAMQVVLALAAGAGALLALRRLWNADDNSQLSRVGRLTLVAAALAAAGVIAYLLWDAAEGSPPLVLVDTLTLEQLSPDAVRWVGLVLLIAVVALLARPAWRALGSQFGVRTGIAAAIAALAVLLIKPGADALASRISVLGDSEGSHGNELHVITELLQHQPPGRKQVGTGALSHWWNLLSYEYGRRPSLLMMGGGGLQASPNYDFLWTVTDFPKNAWVYDAPILVFETKSADKMPAGDKIFETAHYQARRLKTSGLVSPVQITGTLPPGRKAAHAAAIDWFKTDLPLKDHVLAYDGFGGPGVAPHGTVLRAYRQDSPGDASDMVAEVDAAAPTTFMVRESWHPRWHAYVDGTEVPVRRVTPDFPAIDVSRGHHMLSFRFERPWWAQAAWLAWPLMPLLAWLITRRTLRS